MELRSRRRPPIAVRRASTEPPHYTREQLASFEEKVIGLASSLGFVDHGLTDWHQQAEDGTEIVTHRKRYMLPTTNLRITIGVHVTYLYRVIDGQAQIGETMKTIELAKKPSILKYVLDLFLTGKR